MHKFGPNGVVTGQTDAPIPTQPAPATPQRPVLAVALGGPLAVIFVAIFGALWMIATLPFLPDAPLVTSTPPFLKLLHQTVLFCALNVVVFYITVPITWAAMSLAMLALQAHKKNYSPRFFRLLGMALVTLAIVLFMILFDPARLHLYAGADSILAILVAAILVGVPAGALLMSVVRHILYWKKPAPHPQPA